MTLYQSSSVLRPLLIELGTRQRELKRGKLNIHIALGKRQREVGLFFPKEPGTHFIIYNYFIIRLVFYKTEVPVTLIFQRLLLTAMRGD